MRSRGINSSVVPTRLLWILDSFGLGGAESLALPFARNYDRSKYELIVARHSVRGDNVIEDELQRAGVRTFHVGAKNLRDLTAFRRLLRFVRDERIDLIHAHLTYSSIWAALVSRRTGVPSIASLHVAPPAAGLTGARDRLMRLAVNHYASAIVVVSAALRDEYLAQGGIARERLVVVHNGIEVERFAGDPARARARLERELSIPAGVPIAATVSVLRPGKGIEVLLEAIKAIDGAIFVIFGDGPMREEWQALAARSGVADRVRWAGFRKDVAELLAGCDLLVHPTLADAFPTVLMEAMAAGVPIVASNVGGIPEIVVPGVTGTLIPPGGAKILAGTLAALLADRAALAPMSREARAVAKERFSIEAWMARLDAVYDAVLATKRPPRQLPAGVA